MKRTSLPRIEPARWVAAITLSALAVRLVGIRWGIPDAMHFFSYHPDEFSTAGTVTGMLNTGSLNPRFFHYGSLTIYLTALLAAPAKALGWVQSVAETHLLGRVVTVRWERPGLRLNDR